MAAPVYATDLTDILLDMSSTTGWTALGGGAAGLTAPETDFFIQGSNCISKAGWNTATKGMIFSAGAQTIPSGKALFMWVYFWAPNSLATLASGGLQVLIGDATTAFKQFYVAGSDTITFGGWVIAAVDPTLTADATTGTPSATTSFFGAQANVPSSGPSKGNPLGIDTFRFGRELQVTNGDVTNGFATFDGAATFGGDITRRWGLFNKKDGAYFQQGLFVMGLAATAVDFRDSNRVIFVRDTRKVGSAFNAFEVRNATSNIQWTSIAIQALGTTSRGNFITTDNATIAKNGCTFTDMGTFGYLAASTLTNCIYRRCNLVTQGGATFTDCTFDSTNDTVKALTCTNPTLVTGCTFTSSGTKHGMEITGTASTWSLTNITWTGYAATNGSTGNEAIYVNIATGTVTLNVSGGTTPSIRTAGATVNVVANPVSVTITVTDVSGTAIQNARVFLKAAAGGPMPYAADTGLMALSIDSALAKITRASGSFITDGFAANSPVTMSGFTNGGNNTSKIISTVSALSIVFTSGAGLVTETGGGGQRMQNTVTITRSVNTATVTHNAHGMATNDYVWIRGADQIDYNGVFQITKIDANSYSYTVANSPTTPATGTIKATFSFYGESATLGLTDINGQITMSRVFSSAQPVSGWARSASSPGPYYQTAIITGTVSSSAGFSATALMILDS